MLKTYWFFTVAIISLFLSCSDEMNPLANVAEDYFFFTIEEGTFLSSGADIQVSYTETSSGADRVVITLKNRALEDVAVVEVKPEDLKGDGLPVTLPEDLPEDLYLLCFEVWEADVLLSESDVYFYVVDGSYGVSGIETYPPQIRGGEQITARAYLDYPAGSNPWLRWSLDDQILKEGFLSDIDSMCLFSVPDEEGVFSLNAELFPVQPWEEHKSTAFSHTDLFVTRGENDPLSFLDGNDHRFYVSFRSGVEDTQNPSGDVEVIGDPQPERGTPGGYAFSSEDGIRYHYNALPLDALGQVQNFTLSMDFDFQDLPSSGKWRMVTIGDSASSFVLFYSGTDRAFYSGFSHAPGSLSSLPADVLPQDGPVSLDLVYTSVNGVNKILWFLQNEILHESFVNDASLPEDGDTLIGSDLTFPGLALQWLSLGISKNRQDQSHRPDQTEALTAATAEPEVVYARSGSIPEEILITQSSLDTGFYSLEVFLDDEVTSGSWRFSLLDEHSGSYYAFDSFERDETGNPDGAQVYPGVLAISFVNNEDGFFLSHSNTVNGPFPHQVSLNFAIEPYNEEEAGLDAIKEIRLYRD